MWEGNWISQERPKMNATVVRDAGFCLGMLAWLAAGQAPGDEASSYFRGVRSRANVFVSPDPSAVRKVAVLPFKAPTELIGTSVSDLWVTELMRMGFYELLERAQMSKVLSESELAMAGLSVNKAVEVGAMLGADGVIVGTVDEYSTVALRGSTYPVEPIGLQLVDNAT
jgi:curli biogenesis system outer membrane secretion channel CsgG